MVWVVSKIIGDGLSTETAYRTAAQQYGIDILSDGIPVNAKTGAPVSTFYLLQIADADANLLASEPGAFVIPNSVAINAVTRTQISNALTAQACIVNINAATSSADIVTVVHAKVFADIAANAI